MIKGHELSEALENLQCFNCGLSLLKNEQSFSMVSRFKNLAARADAGLLRLTDDNKLKYLRQGLCPMCQPLKELLKNENLLLSDVR